MKPLQLRLTAFGSFAGTVEIDFVRLARHGIFAITGPTGAGKSTIFDALVYALYDELPGFRVNSNVRSQYADPGVPTEVSFSFEVNGESYWVLRRPAQLVPRQRGGGDPIEKQSVHAFGRVGSDVAELSRKRQIDEHIEDLVGLSRAQFEQVVLIPQGQFEEVLKASTADRSTLLKRLFPVEIFGLTTERLRIIVEDRRSAYDGATAESASILDSVRVALRKVIEEIPPPLISERTQYGGTLSDEILDELAPESISALLDEVEGLVAVMAEDAAAVAERRIVADEAVIAAEDLVERFRSWEHNLVLAATFSEDEEADEGESGLLEKSNTAAHLTEAISQWVSDADFLAVLEEREADLEEQSKAWPLSEDDRHALQTSAEELALRLSAEVSSLADAAQEYERICGEEVELTAAESAVGIDVSHLAERRKSLAKLRDVQALAIEECTVLSLRAALLDTKQKTLDEVNERISAAERWAQASRVIENLQKAEDESIAAEKMKRAQADAVFKAWSSGSAGRLATRLVDSEPCPVCGSTEHPAPAVLSEGSPSDEDLDAADSAVDNARSATQSAINARVSATATLQAMTPAEDANVLADAKSLAEGDLDAATSAAEKVKSLSAEISDRDVAIASEDGAIDVAGMAISDALGRLAERRDRLADSRSAYVLVNGSFASTREEAKSRRAIADGVTSFAQLRSQIASTRSSIGRLERVLSPAVVELAVASPRELMEFAIDSDEVERRSMELLERRDHRQRVRGEIATFVASDPPAEMPDLDSLRSGRESARAAEVRSAGSLRVLTDQRDVIRLAPARLNVLSLAIAETRRLLEEAQGIYSLCAGMGSGPVTTRLSLENWVLMDYLKKVLLQANGRLAIMTRERYSLEVDEVVSDGRRAFGLNLAVFDTNTGASRPVSTLSGGETFVAALSLALGLADVVSGGSNRSLGSLFVDEGFGSLDPESLDAVLDVLRSLEDGGRMVGVISHVEELKASLPTGISLESSPTGSHAQIIYPD